MADSIEQLSFELTASALAEQERALLGIRVSASTAIGASSVAGSFLGAKSLQGTLDLWSILASVAFAICFASATWVLRPHRFAFAFRGQTVLAECESEQMRDMRDVYRVAGTWIETEMAENSPKLADLSAWLTLSFISLAVEVILWTIGVLG